MMFQVQAVGEGGPAAVKNGARRVGRKPSMAMALEEVAAAHPRRLFPSESPILNENHQHS